jgi:UDP-N-acetylglucosamine--N-acetylmuramyl-(pentapeptide) pyrophosphoryl-undecaprenol N-acetylglucosamine transferase
MNMRVVLTGGGTGGHAYPALSIGEAIKAKFPDCEIRYFGSRNGIEARLALESGFPFVGLTSRKLKKLISFDTILTGAAMMKGLAEAVGALSEFKPDVVIGTGGYVAATVVLAQVLRRGRTLILEPDVVPGRTNLLLSKYASVICVAFQEAVKNFPEERVRVTGMPVRSDLLSLPSRVDARRRLNLQPELFTLLVIGGSQGARRLNQVVGEAIPELRKMPMQIVHQTGARNYEEAAVSANNQGWANYHVRPYLDEMADAYAAADLALCRCGSSTIAELTAVGLPAILIPYPFAHGDHQKLNAKVLEGRGAGILIDEENLTSEVLVETIKRLVGSSEEITRMSDASKGLGRPGAAAEIADLAVQL